MGANMLLSIDIGNSYIKFAVIDDSDNIKYRFSVSSSAHRSPDEYAMLIKQFLADCDASGDISINSSVICSVVPSLTRSLYIAAEKISATKPFVIASGTKTGFKIKIYDSSELGADIVSNAAAARAAASYPLIIVDMGTATTFTALDQNGDVIGTVIHPGLNVCMNALADSAAKLSEEPILAPRKLIGQNSTESIQSGLIYGHAAMVDGIISKIINEIKKQSADELSLVATGEFSPIITPFCKFKFISDPDLTLKGNALLYRLNRKKF